MAAWATGAWKSDAWFGTAWFVAAAVADDRGSTVFSYGQDERRLKQLLIDEDEILVAIVAAFFEVMDD